MGGASNTNPGAAVNLLEAIRQDPADDTPRLIYADYLLSLGDPVGELIVVQCTRARLQREGRRASAEYRRALSREDELLAMLRRSPATRSAVTGAVRGLVGHLLVDDRDALRTQWENHRLSPIEAVTLRYGDPTLGDVAWLARQPDAGSLTELAAATPWGSVTLEPKALGHLRDDDPSPVWPSPRGPHATLRDALRRIHFYATDADRTAFASDPPPELVELSFMGATREAATLLAGKLPNLQKLSAWLEPHVALEFIERLEMPKLKNLALQGYRKKTFDVEGSRRLAWSSVLAHLTTLIFDAPLDAPLLEALATRAAELETLAPGLRVTSEIVSALADGPLPARLRWLYLKGDRSVTTFAKLAAAPFERLESLTLEGFAFDTAAAEAFAANPAFASLVDLKLVACPLRPAAAAILAGSPHLDGLIKPRFVYCQLFHEAMETLKARWPDAHFLQREI